MIVNLICLFVGGICGVMCMSCIAMGAIEDQRQEAYFRGLKRGRHQGRLEERGRRHHD